MTTRFLGLGSDVLTNPATTTLDMANHSIVNVNEIDSSNVVFTNDILTVGDATIQGNLNVSGTSTLTGTVNAINPLVVGGSLTIGGPTSANGGVTIGDATAKAMNLDCQASSTQEPAQFYRLTTTAADPVIRAFSDVGGAKTEHFSVDADGTVGCDALVVSGPTTITGFTNASGIFVTDPASGTVGVDIHTQAAYIPLHVYRQTTVNTDHLFGAYSDVGGTKVEMFTVDANGALTTQDIDCLDGLHVTNATTLSGTLGVTGATTLTSATASGTLGVTGNTTLGAKLKIGDALTGGVSRIEINTDSASYRCFEMYRRTNAPASVIGFIYSDVGGTQTAVTTFSADGSITSLGTVTGATVASTGALTGASGAITGDFTVDATGSVFHVDSTNNRVGIGTLSPANLLDVNGTIVSNSLAVDTDTIYVDSVNHRLGVNTTTPANDIDVNGTTKTINATVTGNLTCTSTSGNLFRLPKSASAPTPITTGDVYYDTSANKIKVWTGATWETVTSA